MMTIIGHGIDLVDFAAMARLLDHAAEDFLEQCFTEQERAQIPVAASRRLAHVAGQFAAKESVMKALGTGFGDGVAFTDVEIGRTAAGAPCVQLTEGAAHIAASLGVTIWFLSISRCESMALASAIAASSAVLPAR